MAAMNRADESRETHRTWPVFGLVAAGVFLSTMDSSMVNVALPSIMRSFSTTLVHVQWVVLMYLLTITVSLLFWGICADRYGQSLVYLTGVTIFTSGSILCFFASSIGILIGARFIEGCGAAMMMAAGPALIRQAFPREQLGRGLGLVGIATSAGLMSGPVVSGLLINSFSWRAIFLATVPVSLGVLGVGFFVLIHSTTIRQPRNHRSIDWKGALLWAVLVISFIFYGHFLPSIDGEMKLGGAIWLIVLLALFIWAEKTRNSGILPLHLFAKSYYHIGLATAAISFGTLFVVLILMPFYLDYILGLAARDIGLVMTAVPLTLVIVSPTAGMLYDRLGGRYLTTGGLTICFVALLLLATLERDSGLAGICARLALLGMGQSMFLAPNSASLLSRIHDNDVGITSGLLATSRNLGMLAGAAFGGFIFASWFGYFSGGALMRDYSPGQADIFMSALRATFGLTAAFSLFTALLSWQRER
jgi:EmrB/QacA subfamily drug resistance transporter